MAQKRRRSVKGEREKKDTVSGWTRAENSDKLLDKGWARARLYIHSLSIKNSPSAPQSARAHMHLHAQKLRHWCLLFQRDICTFIWMNWWFIASRFCEIRSRLSAFLYYYTVAG